MIDFSEVSNRLREIISTQHSKNKILDKDIALSLELKPEYYAVIKRRKKIPYKNIAYFCKEHSVNMNYILMEEEPKYLTKR